MNILLTNDDGYDSVGINLVKNKLLKYGRVVVVAPKKMMSAKSVAITVGVSVEVKKVEEDVYYLDGTPADCVAFGLSSLGIKFDLVVSGCNNGLNISYDIMYSGTVGACLQALTFRVPAIAFSQEGDFKIVDKHFDEVMDYIQNNKLLSLDYLLNVNFPVSENALGIEMTSIFYRERVTYYEKRGENMYYALRQIDDEHCQEVGSDAYAVYHQKISITKIAKTSDLI